MSYVCIPFSSWSSEASLQSFVISVDVTPTERVSVSDQLFGVISQRHFLFKHNSQIYPTVLTGQLFVTYFKGTN